MSVSRSGEAFDDGGDDTDDIDVPPGLEESMVEESIASGLPELIFSSSEDIHLWLLQPVAVAAGGCCSRWLLQPVCFFFGLASNDSIGDCK